MSKKDAIRRLLNPKSIALFGGDATAEVIRQCENVGFSGELWPVNPRRGNIAGRPCFRSVDELPAAPDASFIAVGPAMTIQILQQLRDRGAGGAVCYASGFSEIGEAGSSLQDELVETAGPMAVVGPNCHGYINYLDGVAMWPDGHGGVRTERGAGIVLQSGNIGISLSMQNRSLPISYLVTAGNQADLALHDYVDAMLDDDRVTAIGLHIEGLDDIAAFSRVAIRALEKRIPIVALKTGTSVLGAETAMSHTSSLAGSDELYAALFKRLGIGRVRTLHEFLETLKFLSIIGPLAGNNVASMSCSGGEASMVADLSERLGLELSSLSAESVEQLHEVLGDRVHISNPLDYHTYIWGDSEALQQCFTAVMSNAYDCTILVLDYPRADTTSLVPWAVAEDALIAASKATGHPVVVMSTIAENMPAATRQRMLEHGIAPMQGLDECLNAIKLAADIGAAQLAAATILPLQSLRTASGSARMLDEYEAKRMLIPYGLTVPQGRLCSASEVAAAGVELGFPVCLKMVSAAVAHKSDAGGVVLNLQDPEQLAQALHGMRHLSAQFLVEEMAASPVAELIIGIKRDDQFGLALIIGAGGILVELLRDSVTLLLPATREDISAVLSTLKISVIIDGIRGGEPGDRNAAIDAIEAIAKFASEHADTLLELDVNPLLVLPEGAIAVDALIRQLG